MLARSGRTFLSKPRAAVHGKVLATGATYDNRLVSIATIENRKIVRWRDYMDSLAAWTALNKSA